MWRKLTEQFPDINIKLWGAWRNPTPNFPGYPVEYAWLMQSCIYKNGEWESDETGDGLIPPEQWCLYSDLLPSE